MLACYFVVANSLQFGRRRQCRRFKDFCLFFNFLRCFFCFESPPPRLLQFNPLDFLKSCGFVSRKKAMSLSKSETILPQKKINLREIGALESGKMSEDFDDFDLDLEVPPTVSELLPDKNNIIRGQIHGYAVGRKLMPGRYGAVYEVLRENDGRAFAAKLEVVDHGFTGLNMEYKILKAASKANLEQIPVLVDRGKIEARFKFLVIPLVSFFRFFLLTLFDG